MILRQKQGDVSHGSAARQCPKATFFMDKGDKFHG